MEKGNEKQPEK